MRLRDILSILAISLLAGLSTQAVAFPELTRHRYTSCTSCHVSPNGGGALTPYGRSLSREILSTWGTEREGEPLHGLLPKAWGEALENSKLRVGGDARWVQTHRDTLLARQGQFFYMQAQAEVAWDEGPWVLALSVGKIEDPRGKGNFLLVGSRYYGMLRFNERDSVRVGRFAPAFGINFADHTLSIRRALGMGPEIDRNTIEGSSIGENHQLFYSGSDTVDSTAEADRERAMLVRYEYVIAEKSRVGGGYWNGTGGVREHGTGFERSILEVHSVAAFDPFFLMAEIDRQEKVSKAAPGGRGEPVAVAHLGLLRANYEPYRGIIPFLQYQYEKIDLNINTSEVSKYGAGASLFPRPHFEIFGIWNRVQRSSDWSDEAYLLLHYYL